MFIGSLLAATLLGLVGLFILGHSRFPSNAEIVVTGGERYELRRRAERNLVGRLLGRSLTVGSIADDIDVGAPSTIARLAPRRSPLSLFGQHVFLSPVDRSAESPLRIVGEDEPVTTTREIYVGSSVGTGYRLMSYDVMSDSEGMLSDDDDYGDDDDY